MRVQEGPTCRLTKVECERQDLEKEFWEYCHTDENSDRVGELAKKRGASRMQIALAWVLSRPGVAAPIVGASKLPHLDEAIDALEVKLSREDCAFLEEPYRPRSVVGPI